MFSSEYVFTTAATSTEEIVDFLKEEGLNEEQATACFMNILGLAGGYYMKCSRETVQDLPKYREVPHFMKRLPPPIGHSVTVINLAKLTPEEEFAVLMHEFGHANYGHLPTSETKLQCEIEADYFAVVMAGAAHLHSALVKIVTMLEIQDDEIMTKRLEALRPYI